MARLFNEKKIDILRHDARHFFRQYDFLATSIEQELLNRLYDSAPNFEKILVRGLRTSILPTALKTNSLNYENCYIPSTEKHFGESKPSFAMDVKCDLAVDSLTFHTKNDLQAALLDIKKKLKPKGIFLAAFYGGETLRELRESLLHSELNLFKGASLRIVPMIDLATSLALLQSTGFQQPVVDKETITVQYASFAGMLRDIKGMGEHRPFLEPPTPLTYRHFRQAQDYYLQHYANEEGKLTATVEIIYMHGING